MDFDWKNWCRFCGNADNNVKFESTIDIEYYFKISDQHPKVCEQCSVSVNELQDFVAKTSNANQLFQDLQKEFDLDNFKINEIREKFNLEILDFKQDSECLGVEIKEDMTFSDFSVIDFQNNSESDDYIKEENDLEISGKFMRKRRTKNENTADKDEFKKYSTVSNNSKPKKKSNKKRYYSDEDSSDEKSCKNDPSWSLKDASKNSKSSTSKEESEYQSKRVKPVTIEILKIICHICNEKLPTMSLLEKHCMKEHDCTPQVPCICGLMLTNYNTYSKHRKKCCGNLEAPYQCDLCPKNYHNLLCMEKHINLKHKIDSVKHRCKICSKEYSYHSLLKKHELIHLPMESRLVHECSQCFKKYPSMNKLKQHTKFVHEKPEKKFTCHLCAKNFVSLARLESHMISHSKFYSFSCDICNKKFKSNCSLKSHKKVHDTQDNYFCEVCNKGFRRFTNRTKHMLTHSNEKPFACPEPTCSRTFKRKTYAITHHNTTHLGRYPFYCKLCNEGFHKTYLRISHMKELHPKEYSEHMDRNKFMYEKNRILYEQKDL